MGNKNELLQKIEEGYGKFSKGQKKSWLILSGSIMIKQRF